MNDVERAVKLNFAPPANYRGPVLPPHIPAVFYVVMIGADIDADGRITRTVILPTMYNTMGEARAVAEALPSATGVLALQARVHQVESLVKDPQIL
jgi:hypothetical protein